MTSEQPSPPVPDGDADRRGRRPLASEVFRDAVIWTATAAAFYIAWQLRNGLLATFAAIIVALLLGLLADGIGRATGLGRRASLAAAVVVVLAVCGITAWRFGAVMTGQLHDLVLRAQAGGQFLEKLLDDAGIQPRAAGLLQAGTSLLTNSLGNFLSFSLSVAETMVVIGVGAAYLAAEPRLYASGLALFLEPLFGHAPGNALATVGHALRLWLLARIVLMVLVGLLTLAAALAIGLPNPVALALIAGLAEAVPYLGPFISAVPALLVAITMGASEAVWTAIAYIAIHIIEGYFAAPLVERYFVTVPPALVLLGIVLSSLLFGLSGIVLAAPMTVAVYIAMRLAHGRPSGLDE